MQMVDLFISFCACGTVGSSADFHHPKVHAIHGIRQRKLGKWYWMKEGEKVWLKQTKKTQRSETEALNEIGFVPTLQFQTLYLDI